MWKPGVFWLPCCWKPNSRETNGRVFEGSKRTSGKLKTSFGMFAYLSATLNLWKEPLELKAAEPLALCYGVALWDGTVEPADVEALYRRWAAPTARRESAGK